MQPILIDSYMAKIVSRCCYWPDPNPDRIKSMPAVLENLIVEPRPSGKGVFIVATDGYILCCGTDFSGSTPHTAPVFVSRPEFPEGYGFDPPDFEQIQMTQSTMLDSDKHGLMVLKSWHKSVAQKYPFSPTEYPMMDQRFLGCIFPVPLKKIRTFGPENAIHFFSECGRFQWGLMPMVPGERLGFCGEQIEVRNWEKPGAQL